MRIYITTPLAPEAVEIDACTIHFYTDDDQLLRAEDLRAVIRTELLAELEQADD